MTDDQTSQADELTEMWDADSLRDVLEANPPPATSPKNAKDEFSVEVTDTAVVRPRKSKKKKKKKQDFSPPVLILLAAVVMVGTFLLVRFMR